jgi:acyl carrier protein
MGTSRFGSTARKAVYDAVCRTLLALEVPDLTRESLRPDSLLVDDLGLDSLKFVDLTVGLEEALGIEVFPMQDWVDEQSANHKPLSVGELAQVCARVVAASRGEAPHSRGESV